VDQAVEHLLGRHEVLSSNSSSMGKKRGTLLRKCFVRLIHASKKDEKRRK
jgi:hypothetical protein